MRRAFRGRARVAAWAGKLALPPNLQLGPRRGSRAVAGSPHARGARDGGARGAVRRGSPPGTFPPRHRSHRGRPGAAARRGARPRLCGDHDGPAGRLAEPAGRPSEPLAPRPRARRGGRYPAAARDRGRPPGLAIVARSVLGRRQLHAVRTAT
ncbi:hypothetical protein DFJ74DRAFT_210798 [Hyaloraphidium curvatum]|nr:hypothetical protein DFJ74DRAFT_210798 [Hyaloraphidium curvatum]